MSIKFSIKESWPMLVGIAVVLYFYLSFTGFNLKYFPGDLGDGRFNTYLLEHNYQYNTGKTTEFWNAPFMYPEKEVISYSDNLIGSSPFYSMFRVVGIQRETAFQLWFIVIALLNYTFSYIFLKAVFKNKYAAVLGALVFTVSIALQSQMTHAQVFPRFPIPIAFWFCYLFYQKLNPLYFFGALFAVVYQLYCGIYLGFLLVIPVTLVLTGIFIVKYNLVIEKIKSLKWSLQLVLYPLISGLAVLPLMLPYLRRSALLNNEKSFDAIVASIPTVRSYFYAHNNGSSIWSFLAKTGSDYPAFYDHQLFVGGIAMASMFVFLGFLLLKVVRNNELANKGFYFIMGCASIASIVLFARYQDYSLYQFVFQLPGFEALRSLTRIINVLLLFFAFSTAFVFSTFFNAKSRYTPYLFIGLILLLMLDNSVSNESYYRAEKAVATKRIDELVLKMKDIPTHSIISYEPLDKPDNAIFYQIDAMLAAQELNLKAVNGYSATSPVGFDSYWRNIDSTSRSIWAKTSGLNEGELIIIQ